MGYVRRDHKILELFLKYATKSQVVTSAYVADWYFRGGHQGPVKMLRMLKLLIEEKVIKVKCEECYLRKMLDACCKGVHY
jgi:hypothetical protein